MQLLKSRKFIIALILVAGLFVVLELANITHVFRSETPTTGGQATKGEPSAASSKDNSQSAGKDTSKANSKDLLEPSGVFVSNHRPNLSGSPAPNAMTSVCNTTPGATCEIIFTKDGVSKSLPSQITDTGGAAYWEWKLQDLELTEGSWSVTAKATLNGNSKSASDAMKLEVAK